MFYSTQILAKKGPLGTVWIAAHLERRLKRNQVFETSITISVDSIINPEAPLALRLSGQLLLGVVRVYSRKVGYLFQDCNDALLKIKSAFTQQGLVDLPADKASADFRSITLPENYDTIEIHTTSNGPVSLMLDGGGTEIGEDLTFTVRDDSITLDADFNALSYEAGPARDEMFEGGGDLELDLENVDYGTDEEMGDEPERLRAADTPGEVSNLDLEGDLADTGKDIPANAADTPGMAGPEVDGGMEPQLGTETPGGQDDDDLGFGDDADTPALVGGTPGMDQLGAMGDTPGNDDNADGDAPELGNSGIVTETAPWGESSASQQASRTRQGMAKRVQVQVDDGADGRDSAELPGQAIRALLLDRTPLITNRGFRGAMNKKRDAKIDRKRKQLYEQALLDKPAIPGPVGGVLAELWQHANAVAMTTREQVAMAGKAEKQAAKRARTTGKQQDAVSADVPEEEPEEVERNQIDEETAGMGPPEYGNDDVMMADEEPDLEILGDDGPGEVVEVGGEEGGEIDIDAPEEVVDLDDVEVSEGEDDLPTAVELLQSGDQEQEQPGTSDAQATTFTGNTRAVLKHLRSLHERKLAREVETGQKDRDGIVGLHKLVAGKKRLDAARWFFELLVLKSKDYVNLSQKEAFADIKIKAGHKISTSTS